MPVPIACIMLRQDLHIWFSSSTAVSSSYGSTMLKTSFATTAIDSRLDTNLLRFTFHDRRRNLHLLYQARLSSSVGELDETRRCHRRRGPCSRDRAFRGQRVQVQGARKAKEIAHDGRSGPILPSKRVRKPSENPKKCIVGFAFYLASLLICPNYGT